jgi:hypothetical protein
MLRSALLLALLPALAWGRIGETRAQMEARYGSGKDIGDQTLYTTDNTSLTVFYSGNGGPQDRVTMEIIGNRPASDGTPIPFTPDEIDSLLKDEGAGQNWGGGKDKNGNAVWFRVDQKIFAKVEKDTVVFRGKDNIASTPPAVPGVVLHDGKK